MIKTFLQSICLGALSLCIALPVIAEDGTDDLAQAHISRRVKAFSGGKKRTYTTVASKDKPQNFAKESKAYKIALNEAVSLHNLMNAIQTHKRQLENYRLIVLDKEISEARVKDFDECNVKWLSTYFKEPKKVWEKLKDSADARMTAYDLNMAVSAEQIAQEESSILAGMDTVSQEENEDSQSYEPFDIKRVMEEDAPEIDIAFSVLNSFYPNQDDWGARKESDTPSLPLWEDQKYLYDRNVWQPKYRKIAEFCEKEGRTLILKEPKIEDEIKYDYHFYDQVKSKHDAFVKQVLAQGCVLTPQLKEPPKVAPRPLPPVYEEIIVIKDEFGRLDSLYPQTPMNPSTQNKGSFEEGTLWDAYKNDKFQHISKKGEFSEYFEVSSNNTIMTLPPVNDLDGNRITKHFLYGKENRNALDAYNNMLDDVEKLKADVEEMAQIAGIDIPQDVDYLKEEDLDRLLKVLKAGKERDLAKAKAGIGNKNSALEDNKKKAKKRLAGSKFHFDDATFNQNMSQANSLMTQSQKGVSSLTEATEAEKKIKQNQANLGEVLQSRDEDLVYLNALEKDNNAELLITERTALIFDEALAQARANQELVNMLDQETNKDKLKDLEDKNYHADLNKSCIKQTDKPLLDMNTIQIK